MKRYSSEGFTLVELLVALGIIVVVAGLVFSAFGPARARSRETVCMSNLKQIGIALRMYMEDFDGQPVVPGKRQSTIDLGLPCAEAANFFTDKYVGSRQVFYCPSYHGKDKLSSLASTYVTRYSAFATIPDPIMEDQRDEISRDGELWPVMYCDSHNSDANGVSSAGWENKRIILLRLNLHVENKLYPFNASEDQY